VADSSAIIPTNKVAATVGSSGSGKTTLRKLLLKFYEPTSGSIKTGNYNFTELPNNTWKDKCGVLIQEGKHEELLQKKNLTTIWKVMS
jgi:ATP-binding cassette, subfamily B, bacterial